MFKVDHVPEIGEKIILGQFGEVVVKNVYHNDRGNYLRVAITHLVSGQVSESDFLFSVKEKGQGR